MRASIGVALLAIVLPSTVFAQEEAPKPKPIGNPGAWIPADGYPPAARATGEQGRVGFTLYVDEAGRVSDCKVTATSESPLLDETTCYFMTANARFEPPRDKKNKPMASKWSSSMRWKLEVPPAPPATPLAPAPAAPPTKP